MATKYMNKQNGKVMEIVKEAEDGRAMIIKFEDGKTSSITTGTFKRWYKAFEVPETVETLDVEPDVENALTEDDALEQAVVDPEEAYVREVMEQKKELGIECPKIESIEFVPIEQAPEVVPESLEELISVPEEDKAGDGTPLAEVGKEIAEQAKEKAQKAKKEKKVKQDVSQSIQTVSDILVKTGFKTKTYTGAPRIITVKNVNDKTVGDIYIGGVKCVLLISTKFVPNGYIADRVRNCPNSHAFDIAYSDLNKLENILNAIKKEEK